MKKIIILLSLLFLFEPLSYSGAKFSAASRNKQRLEKKTGKSAQLKNKPKLSGELQTFGAVYLEDTGAERSETLCLRPSRPGSRKARARGERGGIHHHRGEDDPDSYFPGWTPAGSARGCARRRAGHPWRHPASR